ncbi:MULTISPECIES: hypothetical protein [unclassified Streptomyces]|uniref:hypothetical protein n=1 Tax=unclassified Streptomyces TaxID=2593676 RepID=UPI000697A802|nr:MULTISPECIES: hypothetical protein [unclassified Streptomyces]
MTAQPPRHGGDTSSLPLRELADVERWAARSGPGAQGWREATEGPVEGPVFVVRTATSDGMHQVVGVTRPSAGVAPDEAGLAVLRSVVRAVLDLVEHERGTARTEVALTPRGPRVVGLRLDGDAEDTED